MHVAFFQVNIQSDAAADKLKDKEKANETVADQAVRVVQSVDKTLRDEPFKTAEEAEDIISKLITIIQVDGQSLKSVFGAEVVNFIIKGWKLFSNGIKGLKCVKMIVSCLCLMITLHNDFKKSATFMDFVRTQVDKVNKMDIVSVCWDVLKQFVMAFSGLSARANVFLDLAITLLSKIFSG